MKAYRAQLSLINIISGGLCIPLAIINTAVTFLLGSSVVPCS